MKKNGQYVGVDEKYVPEDEKYVDNAVNKTGKKGPRMLKGVGIGYLAFIAFIILMVITIFVIVIINFGKMSSTMDQNRQDIEDRSFGAREKT